MRLTAVTEAVVEAVLIWRVIPRALRSLRVPTLADQLERARACLERHDEQTKGREEKYREEAVLAINGNLVGI